MNKGIIAAIIAVVALLGAGGVLLLSSKDNDNKKSETSSTSSMDMSADDSSGQNNAVTNPVPEPAAPPARDDVVEAEIEDFAFTPATITVKKGATVEWTNKDSVGHTVTSDDNSPGGGMDSKLLAKGESYSVTFNTVGTFSYHCAPHPNMTGKVVVTE